MATGGEVRTVDLVQAFMWTCDDCGRDNFERAITLAPESVDPNDLPDSVDPEMIQEWAEVGGNGLLAMGPDRVQCCHCGAKFSALEI